MLAAPSIPTVDIWWSQGMDAELLGSQILQI
jgi:hypothetical protein